MTNTECTNCGAMLHGQYCAHCGQAHISYNNSLKHVVPEVLHEYFGFDSQVFASIPALLFKPGRLTNEFNAGRRAGYVPPLRLYLLLSAAYFFLSFSLGGGSNNDNLQLRVNGTDVTIEQASPALVDSLARSDTTVKLNGPLLTDDAGNLTKFGRFVTAQLVKVRKHPEELRKALASNVPTVLFLLMPIVATLLKIVYVRRKRFYIEHLVFSFHSHAFYFVVLSIGVLIEAIWPAARIAVTGLEVLVILVYTFIALRRVYRQGKTMTALSFVAILFGYGMASAVVFLVMTVYTVLTA